MTASPAPRTLLHHGSVYSPADPHATALGLEGQHVVWVGDDLGAEQFRGADTVVDLEGALVTPAFVDAHAHLAQTGQAMGSLDLSGTRSLREALDAVTAFAGRRPGRGLLLGFGWDDLDWPEGRTFTRREVDRAAGDRPVYLARVDVHSAVLSSALVDRMP